VGGFFAPTSRYGDAKDLMSFVDTMHQAGIGVILDWVSGHFPKDEFGLYNFDGTHLYEYSEEDRREVGGWGTARFDLRRGEVVSFLVSNAVYWFERYHVDGLRADAVSSMLYLDYDKKDGEWTPNRYGDNRCLEAIDFFKKLNRTVKSLFPDVLMIAEESSAWKGVTSCDGLGFDLKWNMGWMNDTLSYARTEIKERPAKHEKLTFPMMYAFDEKYVLPVSHDEVVHGKKSFLDKMPGDYWRKFAGARAFEVYKMTMPGKKLTFMGCEIAQFREWSCESGVEWFLLDYESHARHQLFCADLNNFYLSHPELWQVDDGWKGFQWIEPDDRERCIISFRRIAENGHELIVVINFTAKVYNDYFFP
ncbi:MAG: 1,4-alpha-glucan branching enzyme, partial [Clostridia bacterium]|nr:1,4-alpha-glucan branching enzyme [Clostridia bacterium]